MSEEALVVIPLPTHDGGVTYGVARLIEEDGEPVAVAIGETPGANFAPPRKVKLSRYSLGRIREGAAMRPELYFYEGMILPASAKPQ